MFGIMGGVGASGKTDDAVVNYDFTSSLPSAFTFARSSVGTYVDGSGLIATATANNPRFGHNPLTKQPIGMLIEPASTNLAEDSESFAFATTVWGGTATITDNDAVAPDGNTTAAKLADVTVSGSAKSCQATITVANDSELYSVSLFVKKKAGAVADDMTIRAYFSGGTVANHIMYFDSYTGTVSSVVGTFPYGVVEYDDYWYVWMVIANNSSGNTSLFYRIEPYKTQQTGEFQHIWGAQCEKRLTPTSYIKTSGGTATRAAETCKQSSIAWYTQGQGTIIAKASLPSTITGAWNEEPTDFCELFSFSNGTNNEQIRVPSRVDLANEELRVKFINDGNTNNLVTPGAYTFPSDQTITVLASWKSTENAFYIDGDLKESETDTGSTADGFVKIPGALNLLHIGHTVGDANQWCGHIAQWKYYNYVRKSET